jgi:hypothetical protein
VIYDVIVRHFQFLPCIFIQKRKIFKKFYRSHFINNIAKIFTHKKNNSKIVLSKKFYDNWPKSNIGDIKNRFYMKYLPSLYLN